MQHFFRSLTLVFTCSLVLACDFMDSVFLAAPTVSVSPNQGSQINFAASANLPFSLTLSGDGPKLTSLTYKLGTAPAQAFSSGKTLDLTSLLAVGDSVTLTLSAVNAKTSVSRTWTLTRSDFPSDLDQTDPSDPVLPLGAVWSAGSTTFRIWSPDTSNVKVSVGDSTPTTYTLSPVPLFGIYKQVYEVTVNGDLDGTSYQFLVGGRPVRDPYGRMINNTTHRNIVLRLDNLTPSLADLDTNRPALAHREDAIITELHIRDQTIHSSSGVTASLRGKYDGFVETGTVLPSTSLKTGLDHLVEFGVTHVQLLPIYDFHTPTYNWGYDPENYNIPEEQYSRHFDLVPYGPAAGTYQDNSSTKADFADRVAEVRNLVNELHKKGLRVVMDVVYNHTYDTAMLGDITTKYYDGLNLSGVGNSIDAANPMVRRFIRDSLTYWAENYGMDGFRFDLLGVIKTEAAQDWGTYLNAKFPSRNILLYGEPWNGYASDPAENTKVRMGKMPLLAEAGFGIFNGKYRETLKGDNDGTGKGLMFGTSTTTYLYEDAARGLIGSLVWPGNYNAATPTALPDNWDRMFAYKPFQSINYLSAHDNYILYDKITASGGGADTGAIARHGMAWLLVSQGIPFFTGGDEFLRSKNGNKNSYNSPDSDNAINWTKLQDANGAATYKFLRDLIALRKSEALFRLTTYDEVRAQVLPDRLDSGWNGSGLTGKVTTIRYKDSGGTLKLVVVLNTSTAATTWTIPADVASAGPWTQVLDETGTVSLAVGGSSVALAPFGIAILKN